MVHLFCQSYFYAASNEVLGSFKADKPAANHQSPFHLAVFAQDAQGKRILHSAQGNGTLPKGIDGICAG